VSPTEAGAQSEVCQSNVSVAVDENVVRFNVTMYEAHRVHRLYSEDQLRDVELGEVVFKDAFLDEQSHQVTTWNVVHDEVEM